MSDTPSIVFLDIEASGLEAGSFPIEIGWAFLDGEIGSVLIKPATGWNLADWDPMAEELHGIAWQQLQQEGRSAWDVAIELNQIFRGKASLVLSDAPLMDGFWLDRLFEQAPAQRAFQLDDFATALGEAFPAFDPGADGLGAAVQRIHRTEADARWLRELWVTGSRAASSR